MLVRKAVERTKVIGRFTRKGTLDIDLGPKLERSVESSHIGRIIWHQRKEAH